MKDLWPVLGILLLVLPVAALFLFGSHEKGCLPLEDESVPVSYPADELQRERVPK